ncbi:MAG TPA: SRPBCC family protein [Baekduia sp.]|nr:SRPBCC family protein [Baekduia sp.]
MPVTRRSAVIAAAPPTVWQTVADPHRLPAWWPRVERVEGVGAGGFTQVLRSERGALVRADFRIGRRTKPRVVTWSQDLEGTPFAKLLARAQTTITLAPEGDGATRVELRLEQRLQGISRLGGFLVKRAARKQLDAALHALAQLHAAPEGVSRSSSPAG